MILTLLIALNSRSASLTTIVCGLAFGFKSAALQISSATRLLTREKSLLQRDAEVPRRRFLHHPDEHAELDAIGMRLDLGRFRREHIGAALEVLRFSAVRRRVENLTMRIGDRSLADVVVDRMPALFVGSDQFDFDFRSVRRFPLHYLVDDDLRRVLARVDLDFIIMRGLVLSRCAR